MKLDGRILILGTAPDAVTRQLAGEDLGLAEAGALRNDVSTDEITPLPCMLVFDERLRQFAHTGTIIDGGKPFAEGVLANSDFTVIVGGKRYGKGSSREHSPVAELAAGIKLVIAESFERIYRQNCDNIGLLT
jgi:3-isopropylmalate/(R)-2-methylmalate dehydratase large subunit